MGLRNFLGQKVAPKGGIDVPTALRLLAEGGTLVDVRTKPEFEAGHAPGARLVDPHDLIKDAFDAVHGDNPLAEPDKTFVLVCDNGLRSGGLVDTIRKQGYKCEFIRGGLLQWRADGQVLIPGSERRRF